MIYVFDRNEVLLEIISDEDYSEFDFKDKLEESSIFSFNTSRKNNIKKGNKVGFFRKEKFQLFLIDDFTEITYIDESQISVVTISDYNILGNSIIEDKRVINGTLREAAEKALEGSDYKVGIVESFENKNINFYFVSRLKALNDIVNTFNCEIDVRIEIDDSTGKIINKYIDFKHRLGKDTGLRFTFDTNLEVIEKSPIGDHFNVLYGRGKSLETDSGGYSRKLDFAEVNNGKKYVEDLESIKKYGRLEGIYEDDNIENKQTLLSKTLEKLEETKNPKFTYKISLKNLMAFDEFEHYQCEKGDTVLIIDEEEDLVLESRVVEIAEEEDEIILTLSNIQTGLMDEDIESEIGEIKDKIDNIENNQPTIDNIFPNTLPDVPILTSKALYSSVILEWTYSNKEYYTYELFASQIKDFNPTSDNRIFEGKASSYLHEVNPSQTWYYRVRAKNSYGKTTLFSTQVEGVTFKISDATEFFEELAIGHALIKDLDLDKATVGKLKGQYINAKNLEVTDGNGKKTLAIDSYGNVYLDVKSFKISNKQVYTTEEADTAINEAVKEVKTNILPNGSFNNGNNGWNNVNIAISSSVFYKERYWCNFYTATAEDIRYATNEFDILPNRVYNFSMLLAQYSSSENFYRIRIETKNRGSSSWFTVKEFTGRTAGTRDKYEQLSYSFKSDSNVEKCRVWIGKLSGETFDIYVADLFMGTGTIYARKSEFQILDDKISSKVSENEFGTLVEQNAHAVKIAWNNISNYVQFENGGLSIYNGSVTTSQKRSVFDEDGNHFWRDGYYLGKIGTNKYSGDNSLKGFVFDLEVDGAYMSWAVKKNSSSNYMMMWSYANKTVGNYGSGKLHAGCDIDMHNYYLRNVNFEGGGITGTMNFVQITSMNSNGTAGSWYNNCKLQFQNGILINATWG
ncbi:phage tail protein [Clostridium perfringens]|uniref:phage tail protein n=1 Tax=Clostridium perfringens TaxID=1502 RepID=UPI0018E4D1D2|nr:phage tail protein [Clostridium perfringens]MBI5993968.1 phage tail protein [Clostridium perfringens]